MGKIHPAAIIDPFSLLWWKCMIVVIFVIALVVRAPLHLKKIDLKQNKRKTNMFIVNVINIMI